ncbi:MAG: hypothetical protein HY813_03265 [Candidatus Portnoybacteria bacterium]|nr:hypothetical protein [Candidatus Portnoybacteria bacterium]
MLRNKKSPRDEGFIGQILRRSVVKSWDFSYFFYRSFWAKQTNFRIWSIQAFGIPAAEELQQQL